ncbi:unnamed protein product [Heligmosomoides polygyrus]|uniref:Uncharacterized protein n=1 Tax=Heligmosomoides polygyrus TaxID=6339 RepID=A0A3P8ASH5_HELPZ|nr:unnamed protein product [Heligmosomoides polygyrus]
MPPLPAFPVETDGPHPLVHDGFGERTSPMTGVGGGGGVVGTIPTSLLPTDFDAEMGGYQPLPSMYSAELKVHPMAGCFSTHSSSPSPPPVVIAIIIIFLLLIITIIIIITVIIIVIDIQSFTSEASLTASSSFVPRHVAN